MVSIRSGVEQLGEYVDRPSRSLEDCRSVYCILCMHRGCRMPLSFLCRYPNVASELAAMSLNESTSAFSDFYASTLDSSLRDTEYVGVCSTLDFEWSI